MTSDRHRRPWWKRKRWAAVFVLLLAVAYPASIGPAAFATVSGYLPYRTYAGIYGPLTPFAMSRWWVRLGMEEYVAWWIRLAERHSGNDFRWAGEP